MAFPKSWPPRFASGRRSIRFFAQGTTSGLYSDNAFMFQEQDGANPYTALPVVVRGDGQAVVQVDSPMGGGVNYGDPPAQIWAQNMTITNDGVNDLEFSFDGVHLHGVVKAGETRRYRNRYESGIAFRSGTAATGTVHVLDAAALLDGETVVIDDGFGPVTFEFDLAGNGVTPGNVAVTLASGDLQPTVRDKLIDAINGSTLQITAASAGIADIALVNQNLGAFGNIAIVETVGNPAFTVTGMAGGADAPTQFRVEAY